MHTKSDAGCVIQRRPGCCTPTETQRIQQHWFSINGHFYNHKVENSPSEFALYIIHESGEWTKLKDCEYPLISRILHGPCEKIARIFLMEADLGIIVAFEERMGPSSHLETQRAMLRTMGREAPTSTDVARYIKFEMPVLDSFVEKLKEEEQREIIKLTMK
ncbi:Ras association domain family member 4 [Phyllostomus discolor]|uniref:Ras association domain family member 4 n=1 Tax=Phyllostomus discolor TaxID=89673 RepID=A0A834EBN6_9CHIR|nr:Ras association domain family member 4 [Phyllostomus discolor]